jgi:hypothetical protein
VRKQYAQRIALIEEDEPDNALAMAETDFSETFRQ